MEKKGGRVERNHRKRKDVEHRSRWAKIGIIGISEGKHKQIEQKQ